MQLCMVSGPPKKANIPKNEATICLNKHGYRKAANYFMSSRVDTTSLHGRQKNIESGGAIVYSKRVQKI